MLTLKNASIALDLDQQAQHSKHSILATLISFFCLGFGTAAWAPFIPYAQERLSVDHGSFGTLLLCGGLGSMLAMPATGLIIQKVGCKAVISVFLLMLLCILPMLSLAHTTMWMAVALFLFGTAAGGLGVAINLQAVIVEKKFSRNMMSSFHGMCSLGGLIGVLVVTCLLTVGLSPLLSAMMISTLMLILTMIAARFSLNKNDTGDQTVDDANKPRTFVRPKPIILMFGLMCFIAFLSEGSAIDWSGIYLVDHFDVEKSYAGLAYTCFAVAMTIGRFSGIKIQKQLGEDKTVKYGAILAAMGLSLVIFTPIWWGVLCGYILVGFGCSNIVPILFSQVGRQNVMPKATALSYVSTMAYSGGLLGPALIGFMSVQIGLPNVFVILAILILLIAVLNQLAPKMKMLH